MRMPAHLQPPRHRRWFGMIAACAVLCGMAGWAQAQNAATGTEVGDPPDRVARISYVSGNLEFLPAGAKTWTSVSVNRPLTGGDRLSTAPDARAELELGGGTLRLAGGTDFGFLTLNDQWAQIELASGTLNLAVQRLEQGQDYEIDTPTLALVVDQPGVFRIDVGADGRSTRVTVFDGSGTVYGENHTQRGVIAGGSYDFGDPSLDNLMITSIGEGDAFDAWCSERDRNDMQSASAQYVSEDVVGYQDLDAYGDWQSEDGYGAVWFPTDVATGWAPYSFGYWVWIAPWGWTWVDDLPWGFAPFHYGRWAYIHGAWGWIPGPRSRRPIYAPALVAFVGGGPWSASLGMRGQPVGWFPLGPGEIYNPWYRAGRRYYASINLGDIAPPGDGQGALAARIDNQYAAFRRGQAMPAASYVNRSAPHGLSVVSAASFSKAGAVQHSLLRIAPGQLAAAPILAGGADVPPGPASLVSAAASPARTLPAASFDRPVRAYHAPAAAGASRVTMLNSKGYAAAPAIPASAGASRFDNVAATPNRPVPAPVQNAGQRPGLSFISGPEEDRERTVFPAHGLPQVPHLERASPEQVQATMEQQRYDAAREMHDNVPVSAYPMPPQRPYDESAARTTPEQDLQRMPVPTYRTGPSVPRGDKPPPARASHPQSQPARSYLKQGGR